MRIACSTSAFKTDLSGALGTVAGLDFKEVDLIAIKGWDHVNVASLVADFAQEHDRVAGLLSEHGLKPIAMNFSVNAPAERDDAGKNAEREAQVDAVCRLMRALGVSKGGFYPGYYDVDATWSLPYDGVVERTLLTFREMLTIAARYEVTIGPEIHYRTTFATPDQTRALLEALPELTIVYDPSHFVLAGFPLAQTAFMLDRAHHVHLRGAAREQMQASFATGGVDLPWLATELKRRNYPGDFSIEYLPDYPGDVGLEIQGIRQAFDTAWGRAPSLAPG